MADKEDLVVAEKKISDPVVPQSFLVADIGHSNTRVTLFDLVEGGYRLLGRGIAMSTAGSPWYDISHGLGQAIQQVSTATGRVLLDGQGQLIQPVKAGGIGVDHFGAVTSVRDPLKVLVAGLLPDVSIASVRRALQTTYALEVDCFSLADTRDRVAQIEALLTQRPELILLTGGTDGGADRRLIKLVQTLAIGLGILDFSQRPLVVYAGNSALQPKIREALGELVTIYMAGNVRPEFESESLDSAIGTLSEIYLMKASEEIPGLSTIHDISAIPVKTTAHAFAGISEYLATLANGRALCLDVGSSQMSIALTNENTVDLLIRGDLGLGRPLEGQLANGDLSESLDWTYDDTTLFDVKNFIISRMLRPSTLPFSESTRRIEQSLLRQMLVQLKEDASSRWLWPGGQTPEIKLLLLRGGALANAPRPQPALLAVLDAFQPNGVFRVVADENGTLPAMGLLAPEAPGLVVQVLAGAALDNWGWVVVPFGRAKHGELVLQVHVESSKMETMEFEILAGTLELIPLPVGTTATMTLKPAANMDIGFGNGVGKSFKVIGGSIGLLIDARGRPLPHPSDTETRRSLRQSWLRDFA